MSIAGQTAPDAEARHAEGAVLIVALGIRRLRRGADKRQWPPEYRCQETVPNLVLLIERKKLWNRSVMVAPSQQEGIVVPAPKASTIARRFRRWQSRFLPERAADRPTRISSVQR